MSADIASEFKELYEAKKIGDLVRVGKSIKKIIDFLNGLNIDLDKILLIIEAVFDSILGGINQQSCDVEITAADVHAAYPGQAVQQFDIGIILQIVNFVMKLISKFNQP